MQKGLGQSRGLNYEEYGRSLEKQIHVEKLREKEYHDAKTMASEINSQLPK
ncbi:hypothetical protein [Oceanobacillus kimchii]|nr:hypothetical protein [Oceanobacillus kimchii]